MAYVHFDLAEVERQMRAAHARAMTGEPEVDVAILDGLLEPIISVTLQAVSLRNEGVAPGRIGDLIGRTVGTMIINAASCSGDFPTCFKSIFDASNALFDQALRDGPSRVHLEEFVISGTRGGRA